MATPKKKDLETAEENNDLLTDEGKTGELCGHCTDAEQPTEDDVEETLTKDGEGTEDAEDGDEDD